MTKARVKGTERETNGKRSLIRTELGLWEWRRLVEQKNNKTNSVTDRKNRHT